MSSGMENCSCEGEYTDIFVVNSPLSLRAGVSLLGDPTRLESSSFESSGRWAGSISCTLSDGEWRGDLNGETSLDSVLILSFEGIGVPSGLHFRTKERMNIKSTKELKIAFHIKTDSDVAIAKGLGC